MRLAARFRSVASMLALLTPAGCASTIQLAHEGRYFEACERTKGKAYGDPEATYVRRSVAARLRGVVRLRVLDAEAFAEAASTEPKRYGAWAPGRGLWAVQATVAVRSAASPVIMVWLTNRDINRWKNDAGEVIAEAFGLPAPPPPGTMTTSTFSTILSLLTLGVMPPDTHSTEDPHAGSPGRAAAQHVATGSTFVRPPEDVTIRAFFSSASQATMSSDDFLTLFFSHHFREPDRHWACGVDVGIKVPLRVGTNLREQLDGTTIALPVPTDMLDD
jgi:hypothetical protein